jgi:hypothetical protein
VRLPDTTTSGKRRGLPLLAGAVIVLILAVPAALLLPGRDTGSRDEFMTGGVADLRLSTQRAGYPPEEDVRRFEGRPRAVYVYLTVREMDAGGGLEARVRREGFRPWPLGGIRVVDEAGDRLIRSREGVSGLLRFAVVPESGGRLPEGRYTLSVYRGEEEVARRWFEVGG